MSEDTTKDWSKSTVAELKEELAARQLSTGGLKKELIKRLQDDDAINSEEISAEDVINDVINAGDDEQEENLEDTLETTKSSGNCEGADMVEEEENQKTEAQEKTEETKTEKEVEETADQQDNEQFNEGEEEEELNMEDMVAVDETHDDDDEEDKGHLDEDDEKLDIEKLLKSDEDEMMVLPPAPMNKWVFTNFLENKNNCSLFVSKLTAKDVLGSTMVEWSNRALYFCINHDKSGNGCAVLNYSTVMECEEAKKAIQEALGESVTISHPSAAKEKDMKKEITYLFDSTITVRNRLLFVEGVPKETTVEELCSVFDDALFIIQLRHEEPTHKWEKYQYVFPEEMQSVFVLEFANAEALEKTLKSEKELNGAKLTFKIIGEIEEDYKRFYARKLREAKDKKWEVLEKKKKQDLTDFTLTDEERLKLYRNISALNRYKGKLTTTANDRTFENKVLEKETIIVKLFETRQKIDGDTNRRLKNDLMLPEEERFMTKHTQGEYGKLSSELKRKMQKQAKDPFTMEVRKRAPSRGRQDRNRKDRGGRDMRGSGGRPDRDNRQANRQPNRGGPGGPDRARNDRSMRGGRRDMGRGGQRRDIQGRDRSIWRSPDRTDPKRRRMDEFDDRDRRGNVGGMEMANTLKGLTEVISHKMNEIERLAGGMKARERALEEAYSSIAGGRSNSGSFGGMGSSGGGGNFSNMGFSSNSNFMSHGGGGGGYSSSGMSGGRYQGGMSSRSNMGGSMDRRRSNDVDDRFSRF